MSTPREIVADAVLKNLGRPIDKVAESIISALEASGFRVVPVKHYDALVGFAKEIIEVGFDGGQIEDIDIEFTADEHGLVRPVAFDPTHHAGLSAAEDCEPGDIFYMYAGPLAAAPPSSPEQVEV